MQDKLTSELLKYNPSFSQEEIDLGLSFFKEVDYEASTAFLEIGDVCECIFYAESSVTKCFYIDEEGREQTLWMKPERTFITEYKSFVSAEKSQFSLHFYEKTRVHMILRKDLMHLYNESRNWALFGISLTERVHMTLIDVFVNLLANDATRNYQYIEYMFPRFIQVAPLKDIASMLQISQVSLSRIRGGKQLKK